ncbi:gamma-glutamyltransferase family protein [Serpentinicella sp. ANB-PHB4]|uniref:gamma-glutamyltransferase family protein n=1 Tax=Serpentinicella sp. ANB-PHB4 TaxID=3074076 RepID=UPI00285CB69F|nr:gamma-glutamyltransferase family protein [Serpentinicella sp. ANB-PHB4]MDR5658795.1 gamma-glutamyltransferase family protein [Serpentinicella sp. ANB-PHB4]
MASKKIIRGIIFLVVIVALGVFLYFQGYFNGIPNEGKQNEDVGVKTHYGVSAGHPIAVDVGMEVLSRGGNAADAAIAVSYVLGVVEPYASGIGGGGVMLVHPGEGEETSVFDYREVMPYSSTMLRSHVGVPGFVKGMEEIHQAHGSLPMEELIAPAIELAEQGFGINVVLSNRISDAYHKLPRSQLPHFFPNGQALGANEVLIQEALAQTLRIIQEQGAEAFYSGQIGQTIANRIGSIELSDLNNYEVIQSEAISAPYRGYDVITAPAPLAGITLIQMLQMAEVLELNEIDYTNAQSVHLYNEITKRAYQDRISHIADPDYHNVPVELLLSPKQIQSHAEDISYDRASTGFTMYDTPADEDDGHNNTTHFVIVDGDGMMISATHTLSHFFGSGVYIDGFFINNQLYNFSTTPGSPNYPEPGKRTRSFIAPVILEKEGVPVLGIGTPGGRHIPEALGQVMINLVNNEKNIQNKIDLPRFLNRDDAIYVEATIPREERNRLRELGYIVVEFRSEHLYGGVHGLYVDPDNGRIYDGGDPRRGGASQARN